MMRSPQLPTRRIVICAKFNSCLHEWQTVMDSCIFSFFRFIFLLFLLEFVFAHFRENIFGIVFNSWLHVTQSMQKSQFTYNTRNVYLCTAILPHSCKLAMFASGFSTFSNSTITLIKLVQFD